jgi:hypothetical protein
MMENGLYSNTKSCVAVVAMISFFLRGGGRIVGGTIGALGPTIPSNFFEERYAIIIGWKCFVY